MDNVRLTITDDLLDYYEQMEEEFKGGASSPEQGRRGGRIGFQ